MEICLDINARGALVSIFGIAALTALEITAMLTGEDGAFFLPIAGAIGVAIGLPIKISK